MQLLARNLGIPNVVVDPALVPAIRKAAGRRVQLAVSPAGSVELDDAAPATPERGTETSPETVRIEPNLEKLNLRRGNFIRLSSLRASDSGRIVGPKAAKLGELHHHYPEAVADGLAIPFGVFRALLGLPYHDSGLSMFDWMRSQYRALEKLPPGSAERAAASESLRRRIHAWILHADPGQRFRTRLRETMAQVFGFEGTYGVFVRSDTNIEDLPGFSGAGLNLTVPNVVDFDALLKAISRVWASPFSKRAFAWRQGRMQQPEHVYPAVLLMRTVPVQKSGVMVTRDVDSGAPRLAVGGRQRGAGRRGGRAGNRVPAHQPAHRRGQADGPGHHALAVRTRPCRWHQESPGQWCRSGLGTGRDRAAVTPGARPAETLPAYSRRPGETHCRRYRVRFQGRETGLVPDPTVPGEPGHAQQCLPQGPGRRNRQERGHPGRHAAGAGGHHETAPHPA